MFRNLLPFCTGTLLAVFIAGFAAGADLPKLDYSLNADSKVSIAIYNEGGGIVRQLLLAADRKAGQHTEEWNGLDDKGNPLPAGSYTWKLLSSLGLQAEWVTSLGSGLNPGWQIMPGNHVGAVRATLAENGDVFVMGGCSEVVPGLARITCEGKVVWHSGDLLESNNDCGTGVAGGKLFSLLGNAKVIAIDPATGKGLWKVATDWNDVKDTWKPGSKIISLAARGDQLIVSNKSKNAVQWLNPENGEVIGEASVDAPVSLAIDSAGNVLAITGKNVVRFSRDNKKPQVVIRGLAEPIRLAVNDAGEVFVAEGGDVRQIKRFASDGTLLETYGRKGGRLYGEYDPQDFRGITGLTADRNGGFIVAEAEAAPRRLAFFDKSGNLVREWYGGLSYANGGTGDPADLSIVWFFSGGGEVVKAKIDFVDKSYKVLETYKMCNINDVIAGMNTFGIFSIRHRDDRTYIVNSNIEPRMVMVDKENRRLVPCVSGKYYLGHDFLNFEYTPKAFVRAYFGGEIPADAKYGAVDDARNKEAVIWTDLNGDGRAQNSEMAFSARKLMTWSCARIWPDENMNLYIMNDRPMVWQPKRWTANGVPVYGGWPDWQPLGDKPVWFDPLKVSWPAGSGAIPLSDGSIIGFFNNTENGFGKGIGSDGLGGNYIVKWNKSGKAVWCTGFHSPDFDAAPGEGRFFWNFAGTAHDCVAVTDMQCYFVRDNLVHVWDPDGLWVGRLLENPDLKAAPREAYSLATENFGGKMIEVTQQNKVPGLNVGDAVYYGCGQNVTGVYRITGWETFRRQNGSVSVSADQVELAKFEAFKAAAGKSTRVLNTKKYVAATLPEFDQAPVIDGKLTDEAWKKAGVVDDFRLTPSEVDKEKQPTTILTGYDSENLYIGIRCAEDHMEKLRAFGSPLHLDDSVELFIDRNCDRTTYFQIMVNARGKYYVGYGWQPRTEITLIAKATRQENAWTVELAIPWKNIDATAPAPGEKLGFTAVRNRFAGGETHSNWSPLCGNLNHSPNHFGTLYVGDALPRQAVALREGRAFIRNISERAISIDGSLDEWRNIKPLTVADGTTPVADVYLGWKPDGLYAAFDVKTDRPWANDAAAEMAFNGGACVDLNIAPAGATAKMAPGSVRFLAAPLDGVTRIVEFLPKLTADLEDADKAPRLYHTDAQGDNLFDRVAALPQGMAAARPKADGSGYIVEMRVPLRAPLRLESGRRFRFDASVIISNKKGNRAERRIPLFSTSGDDMFVATDVIVETTLRPANWGEAELE